MINVYTICNVIGTFYRLPCNSFLDDLLLPKKNISNCQFVFNSEILLYIVAHVGSRLLEVKLEMKVVLARVIRALEY